MKIRVGSRDSALAVRQAEIVISHIERLGFKAELVTMKTSGDLLLDQPLDKIGGKGLFVKELDKALLDGAVDVTVHSYKDLPMQTDGRLPVVAVSAREDPRDVLILPSGVTQLDFSKPVGCSSARRRLQLKRLFPDIDITPLRGNVLTRIGKLDKGEYSAIVLALAGIKRLGLEHRVSRVFEPEEMLPAACQGILAVQARRGFDARVFEGFHNADAHEASVAERGFIAALGADCSSPAAAYAVVNGSELRLSGLYEDESGHVRTGTVTGGRKDGARLGRELAAVL